MEHTAQALLSFFEQVARKDDSRLSRLKEEGRFSVEQERWCFTLPDLYLFLRSQDDAFNRLDYKEFRRLVFGSPIGQTVKLLGAEIAIVDNRAKVDASTYALVWRRRG
jgi:hypothetical protein